MQLKSMLVAVATMVAMGVAGCSSESENVPEVEPDGTKGGKTETPAELNLTASEIKAADRTAGFQAGYLAEALNLVEMNMARVLAVKSGDAEPDRCELCDCCRKTRVLKAPISITDLTAGI